jgi:hypothetical protein
MFDVIRASKSNWRIDVPSRQVRLNVSRLSRVAETIRSLRIARRPLSQ